jgi:hypothetical protein
VGKVGERVRRMRRNRRLKKTIDRFGFELVMCLWTILPGGSTEVMCLSGRP